MLHAVVLAGGSGTRFWPQSRRALPKQFLSLGGPQTLLQQTLGRLDPLCPADRTWVVTASKYAEETTRQLPALPLGHLITEPVGRNTAAAIALAAHRLLLVDPDPVMVVIPADHQIEPIAAFQQSLAHAAALIEQWPQSLVLMGATPTFPATGFGYIRTGEVLDSRLPRVLRVREFREKPDLQTAASYVKSGEYLWNCGLFAFRARAILDELSEHAPLIAGPLRSLRAHWGTPTWNEALAQAYAELPSVSIDVAVLELARERLVIEAPFNWDDVGSWQALARIAGSDEQGNTIQGTHFGLETHDCILRSAPGHLLVTSGVEHLIIIQTPTATLVADRRDEAAMRRLVDQLAQLGFDDYL